MPGVSFSECGLSTITGILPGLVWKASAIRLFQIGASLAETTGPIERIYASGGFTRSDMWLQMIADVFDKEVELSGVADASAIGAAIMGFLALGLIDGLDAAKDLIHVVRTYKPNAARHAIYQENFRVFAQLYGRLQDLMDVPQSR